MMKIFFRISKLGFGGAERVFISVAQELMKDATIEVAFVVDKLVSGETEKQVQDLGIKVFNLEISRTLRSVFPFKNLINAENPDIIISAYTDTNFSTILSNLLSTKPAKVVVSEHASLQEHWQSFSRTRKLLLNLYVRVGYRFADHLLAVSKGIADQLLTFGYSKSKVSYIHNPVRFKSFDLNQKKQHVDVVNLLAIGRITPQKDYKTLILAFANIVKSVNCKLTIVGGIYDFDENAVLISLIKELGLQEKIEFVGFTDNVQSYYVRSDIFVLSSAWEGFGNVIVEAMAFGLPIVATDCNHGPAEILEYGKYGRLVPIRSPQAMAEAILDTIAELPIHNRSLLLERASDFSEQKVAAEYIQLFQSLATKS